MIAVAPENEKVTGTFWSDCLNTTSVKISYNKEEQKKLWDYSVKAVGLEEKN